MKEAVRKKVTVATLYQKFAKKEKAVFLTAYDYPMAHFADQAGVDMVLVGDSGGMTTLGHKTTTSVTMPEMELMATSVCRAVKHAFIVGDMPFLSYQTSNEDAIRNGGRFIQIGCDAVKCEGGVRMAPRVRAMTDAGIAVMGHIGLTPQSYSQQGGYKVQGKTLDGYHQLVADAKALQDAGAFSILLEAIPAKVAEKVRNQLSIPCYGIGAGKDIDGQLVILHDMLGMFVGDFQPRFVKRYRNLAQDITQAIGEYCKDVRAAKFPSEEHFYPIETAELNKILKAKKG